MKKQLKNLLLVVALVATTSAIVIACSENSGSNEPTNDTKSRKLSLAYLSQIPFVTGSDTPVDAEFVSENELYKYVEEPTVSWTYFDNLYNDSLQNSIKQDLSYIILCKKDLIGLVNNDPSNTTLITALKKHVDNLVNTNYLGYTALYYALDALNNVETETIYVQSTAAKIALYAENDPFHPDMIEAGPSEVGAELYEKIKDNYDYLSEIASFE